MEAVKIAIRPTLCLRFNGFYWTTYNDIPLGLNSVRKGSGNGLFVCSIELSFILFLKTQIMFFSKIFERNTI